VLALRVWKAPLESFDPETLGGLTAAPLLGSPESIADAKAAADYARLRSHQVAFGLDALYTLVALTGLLFWLHDRRQRLIFWMLVFAGSSAIFDWLVPLGPQLPSNWAIGAAQPLLGIISVATWFVLILLLELDQSPRFVKLIRILALVQMLGCCLLGIEVVAVPFVPNGGQPVLQWIDGILTALFISLDTVPIFLVLYGVLRRGRLSVDRWVVAACAFLADGIPTARIAFAQGARFTHWTISARIAAPLFVVRGSPVNAQTIAQTLLLAAVVYAAWRYTAEESRRRAAIDRELENAREVQQLLVPTAIPQVAGFILTSNYRPAQEVGGDFFQIIPASEQDGSSSATLVVLGDVSGKGVKAAMAVSLIVGALRMAAESISKPAQILAALNRRLCGRMAGGFATAVALYIDADGRCVIASAGHNPPLINGEEFSLGGSLPLGLDPGSAYEETQLFLRSGDRLALYTDGLVEARNASGELFGFDRLRSLFSRSPTAEEATDAAVTFGQEDDITVVTLTLRPDQDQVAESVQTPGLSHLPA
jgi:serine phosphatase RsbU (regulator of sigma subunit)